MEGLRGVELLPRRKLPRRKGLSWQAFLTTIVSHARFERPSAAEAWSYNLLQRLSYLIVIFVLFPLGIWTGLAMSPAFTSAVPASVTLMGGRQSARTNKRLQHR
jgi:thiosulfate reductase cytochrome b subunit